MNTIPTAKEFYRLMEFPSGMVTDDEFDLYLATQSGVRRTIKIMEEFAKLHVEACKKEIAEKVRIIDDPRSYCGNTGSEYPPNRIIDKNSILNAYPLTKIL